MEKQTDNILQPLNVELPLDILNIILRILIRSIDLSTLCKQGRQMKKEYAIELQEKLKSFGFKFNSFKFDIETCEIWLKLKKEESYFDHYQLASKLQKEDKIEINEGAARLCFYFNSFFVRTL